MAVFPLDDLNKMRPDWLGLDGARIELFEPAHVQEPHLHDYNEVLIMLEGSLSLRLGSEEFTLGQGEVALIRAGQTHRLENGAEPAVAISLQESPQAPFRQDAAKPGAAAYELTYPNIPLASPYRRAHIADLDPAKTFSPESLGPGKGDIFLQMELGAIGELQAKEIVRQSRKNGQMISFVRVDVLDREIDFYFMDRYIQLNLEILHPAYLITECDLAAENSAGRMGLIQKSWRDWLRVRNVGLLYEIPMRNWTPEEMARILSRLSALPPLEWGVVLRWDEDAYALSPMTLRQMIRVMIPWLKCVICPQQRVETLNLQLAALGFQGWIAVG